MAAAERALAAQGHEAVHAADAAELILFNTCAVTAEAERKSRQMVRRLRRENPVAGLVVTGCYAEMDATLGGWSPAASRVLGNGEKRFLLAQPAAFVSPAGEARPPALHGGRTRALVRVQEGCDNRCAYCVVWRLRGPQVSRPAAEVVDEVRALVAEGRREVVLTGVHTGAYGRDANGAAAGDLSSLIRLLLEETEVARLRLSSIEPWDLSRLDPSLWGNQRLCRHLHVPLQSGSDAVLSRMGRRYTAEEYRALIGRLQAAVPDLAVSTDVIAGFPGESVSDHQATLALARACGFARMHVFPYSERPGTAAAAMDDQVPLGERRRRAAELRVAADSLRRDYGNRQVGRLVEVLWETQRDGWWHGLTSNYLGVWAQSDAQLRNTRSSALIGGWEGDRLCGVIVSAGQAADR